MATTTTDATFRDEEAPPSSSSTNDSKKTNLLDEIVNDDIPGDVRVILKSMFISSYHTLDNIHQDAKPQGLHLLAQESWVTMQQTLIPLTKKLLLPPSLLVPLCCFIPAILLEFFLWFHQVMTVGNNNNGGGGYIIFYLIAWAIVTVALLVAMSQYAYQTNREVDQELNSTITSTLSADGQYAMEFMDGTSSNIFRTRILRLRPVTPDAIAAAAANGGTPVLPVKEKDSSYATVEFVVSTILIAAIISLFSVHHSL
mmetsp:Transcript_14922/g.21105  ORF Transcript_14922/g.21105 Transcript_14922/m.21105 type:complete len:256 (-) Transcript_14922:321-1088(-)